MLIDFFMQFSILEHSYLLFVTRHGECFAVSEEIVCFSDYTGKGGTTK